MMRRMNPVLTMLAVAAMGHVVSAQGGGSMAKPMANEKTYTGCLETGSTAGTFTLTHAAAAMAMGKDSMGKDSMGKDGMKKDAMGMSHDQMAPETFALTGTGVDFATHVGHKVSVTAKAPAGGGAMKADAMAKSMPSLTVSSLTMVATTCK